jgi:GNAT superfamily N-acetyltransferase
VVRVEARPSCELLEWDSEHFGFPVARLRGSRLDEASAGQVDEWSRARGVRCIYFLADPDHAETSRVARAHGFAPVDVRLTLRHELDPLPENATAVAIREARPEDVPALRRLATRSHHSSRFYQDPAFSRERCDALYASWIESGIRDPERWVYAPEVDGAPIGYQLITPATPGGIARMDLLAIDEAHHGKGVGRALLASELRRAASHGASAVETVIQERNGRALRIHLAVGFTPIQREIWHHKWFER